MPRWAWYALLAFGVYWLLKRYPTAAKQGGAVALKGQEMSSSDDATIPDMYGNKTGELVNAPSKSDTSIDQTVEVQVDMDKSLGFNGMM